MTRKTNLPVRDISPRFISHNFSPCLHVEMQKAPNKAKPHKNRDILLPLKEIRLLVYTNLSGMGIRPAHPFPAVTEVNNGHRYALSGKIR